MSFADCEAGCVLRCGLLGEYAWPLATYRAPSYSSTHITSWPDHDAFDRAKNGGWLVVW